MSPINPGGLKIALVEPLVLVSRSFHAPVARSQAIAEKLPIATSETCGIKTGHVTAKSWQSGH
jgi:hypothetical protein